MMMNIKHDNMIKHIFSVTGTSFHREGYSSYGKNSCPLDLGKNDQKRKKLNELRHAHDLTISMWFFKNFVIRLLPSKTMDSVTAFAEWKYRIKTFVSAFFSPIFFFWEFLHFSENQSGPIFGVSIPMNIQTKTFYCLFMATAGFLPRVYLFYKNFTAVTSVRSKSSPDKNQFPL